SRCASIAASGEEMTGAEHQVRANAGIQVDAAEDSSCGEIESDDLAAFLAVGSCQPESAAARGDRWLPGTEIRPEHDLVRAQVDPGHLVGSTQPRRRHDGAHQPCV